MWFFSPAEFDLNDLHVYGDMLKLYSLHVNAPMSEVGNLYNEFMVLDRKILTLYVSYILAGAGFDLGSFKEPDVVAEWGELSTTGFSDKDWIDNLEFVGMSAEEVMFDWSEKYQKGSQELKVIFLGDYNTYAGIDQAQTLHKRYPIASEGTVVILHPRLTKKHKDTFYRLKEEMKNLIGEDIVYSTGEFTANFIPDKTRRGIIEENWKALRSQILAKLRKDHPFLVLSTRSALIEKIEERLRNAEVKYLSRNYEDAVGDAGKACEGMLQIFHEYMTGKPTNEQTLSELLDLSRGYLEDNLGQRFLMDLDFIRDRRNIAAHEKMQELTKTETIEVIRRAQLFHEIFLETVIRSKGLKGSSAKPD